MAINIDAAGEWASETASRWLTTDPMDGLDSASRPEDVRKGVVRTIAETSAVMAEKTRSTGCYPNATREGCKAWLEACCNQMAEPDQDTLRVRTVPRLGDKPAPPARSAPMLRWAGGSREQAQRTGFRWTRGRGHGALEFEVVNLNGTQTIVEHGWPADESSLVKQMASAIATATHRTAEAQKTNSASIATIKQTLVEDARRYSATSAAQAPDWTGAPGV